MFKIQSTLVSFISLVILPICIAFISAFLYNNISTVSIVLFSNKDVCIKIFAFLFTNSKSL